MNEYQKILKSWTVPEGKSTEQAWSELEQKLSSSQKRQAKVIQLNWKPLVSVAAAAAVLIIAVVMVWPKSLLIRRETAAKHMETFVLPDNSRITLNASSSIEYSDDWDEERTLTLNGEAFFEVEKGSTFTVVTKSGLVKVLGTSFDVLAREDQFRVECSTGRVSVIAGKNEVEITPGNAVELVGNVLQASQFDTKQSDWRAGEFQYTDEPLNNVFDEIERQFEVIISRPNISERRYSGRFSNKNLKDALQLVCEPMSLRFEITTEKQVLVSQP